MTSPNISRRRALGRGPRAVRPGSWLCRAFLSCATALPLVASTVAAAPAPGPVRKVVLVTVDGLDAAALGVGALPALERLGARGRFLRDARSPVALAFPATVALLAGRSPRATGVTDEATRGLGPGGRTLAEALGAGGFRGLALPADPLAHAKSGLARGFDRFLASSPALPDSARVDSALAWIDGAGRRFAWLGLTLGAPAEPGRRSDGLGPAEGPALAARLRELDVALARLERGLERSGLPAVTVVAVAGTGGSAWAIREERETGAGRCVVPIVLAGPGVGARVAAPAAGSDAASLLQVAPTLAALAGARTAGFEAASLAAPVRAARPAPGPDDCPRDPRAPDPGDARADASCREAWEAAAGAHGCAPDSVAIALLDRAAQRCPGSPRATLEYASALSRAGREADAARRFLDLLARHPDYLEGVLAYADHLLRHRRFEMVGRALAPIREDSPLAALAAWRGALARIGTLDLVTARDEVAHAASLAVPTAEALETPARLERLHAARRAADFEPRSLAARIGHARALGDLALYEEAYRELHVARGIDATSAEPDYWMGTLLMSQGRARHAVPTFERALQRDPGHRPSRLALADGLLVLNRRADARGQLERALAQDPSDARAQYNLACLLALDGEADAALDALGRALDHGYSDWERLERDPDLESVRADPRFGELRSRPR